MARLDNTPDSLWGITSFVYGTPARLLVTLFSVVVLAKAISYRRSVKTFERLTGFRIPFAPLFPGSLLPLTSWNPGLHFQWEWRHSVYKKFGWDTFSVVPYMIGKPGIYTSNLDVIRQVASSTGGSGPQAAGTFIKPLWASAAALLWGGNLITAEGGNDWRRHRRLVGPAFNNQLYNMVWDETLETSKQITSNLSGDNDTAIINLPAAQTATLNLALLIITKCGFGLSLERFQKRNETYKMSFQDAVKYLGDYHLFSALTPRWALRWVPFRIFRQTNQVLEFVHVFLKELVAERQADVRLDGGQHLQNDLFSKLIHANEVEESKYTLDDNELIGNVWAFIFAGHETTAFSLAATLGLLAYHEDIQAEIYEQVITICKDSDPTFSDYPKLNKVLAAFYEALRLFPIAFIMIRESTEDTTLDIPNAVGEDGQTRVHVPKGTTVICDMIGLQHNERYYANPENYDPSRWYDIASESEAFTSFSIGARGCIGRKFATTEAVAFLTMILRDYKIVPLLKKGETKEEWKERALVGKIVLTLHVEDTPIRLVPRKR